MNEESGEELDFKVRMTRDYILPILPETEEGKYSDITEEQKQKTRNILAKKYVEQGFPWGAVKVLFMIAVYDYMWVLQPQSYGIILDAYAGLLILRPSLKEISRMAADTVVRAGEMPHLREDIAEEHVLTNVGLIVLVAGFGLQLFAVNFIPSGQELFSGNILNGRMPAWIGASILVLLPWIWDKI